MQLNNIICRKLVGVFRIIVRWVDASLVFVSGSYQIALLNASLNIHTKSERTFNFLLVSTSMDNAHLTPYFVSSIYIIQLYLLHFIMI